MVIDPEDKDRKLLDERGIRFIHQAVTKDNYRHLLTPLLTAGGGQGFCVNLSVDTSSVDIMELCNEIGALLYRHRQRALGAASTSTPSSARRRAPTTRCANDHARPSAQRKPGSTTAVSCCGANPGMVSWFVKQALVNVASDTGLKFKEPKTREDWARLAKQAGVKGIHIAERDTQRARKPKPMDVFVNTWSVEGFISEGHAAGRARLGHAREVDAGQRPQAQDRLPGRDLHAAAGRQYARALLDADRAGAIRLSGHPQRVDLDRRLFDAARAAAR